MSFKYKLPPGYEIRELSSEEFGKLWPKPAKKLFNDRSLMFDRTEVYSKKQRGQFSKLRELFASKSAVRINLGLFYRNKFVGWAWGFQELPTEFYMCNSAVLEEHREKGLYTCLLKEMLARATEMGFSRIYSRHMITNNSILIAKMKQGFKITHFELSEHFGTMVHLSYFPTQIQNDILDFRSGHARPNKKLKKIFRLE